MTHDCAIDPHEKERDPLCEQMTHETFEQVVNAPATKEELRAVELADTILKHPIRSLILKRVVNGMLNENAIQELEEAINEACVNHPEVETVECLDILMRD